MPTSRRVMKTGRHVGTAPTKYIEFIVGVGFYADQLFLSHQHLKYDLKGGAFSSAFHI
jgi:hypothetical protein